MTNQHDRACQVKDQGRLAYSIGSTDECLTSRAGLGVVLRMLRVLGIADWAERLFPAPGSNCGDRPGRIIETLVLMLCEGSNSWDEVRVLHQEQRLLRWAGLGKLPSSHTLSRWLRKQGVEAVPKWQQMSRPLVAMCLRQLRVTGLTFDLDAAVFQCKKKSTTPTYQGRAGYQRELIEYCHAKDMAFAIRAVMNTAPKRGLTQPSRSSGNRWSRPMVASQTTSGRHAKPTSCLTAKCRLSWSSSVRKWQSRTRIRTSARTTARNTSTSTERLPPTA